MDPVGPWSAYAYNRLSGVQGGTPSGSELHHHLAGAGNAPPTTSATPQLLPGSFLPAPPGYESVFSPLFHNAVAKPTTHYITQQQRQAIAQAQAQAVAAKQTADGDFHNAQAFFDQNSGAWQQNSPFGVLPHESVVSTTIAKSYENFNAHFAAQSINHLNSLAAAKNAAARNQSAQASVTKSQFYQAPTTTYSNAESSSSSNKSYANSQTNSPNIQQTCIVSTSHPSPNANSKEYRVPQPPQRSAAFQVANTARGPQSAKQSAAAPQIQTKAQTKIYDIGTAQSDRRSAPPPPNEDSNLQQQSVISFSIMDGQRLNYNNSNAKRNFQGNFRQYQQGINTDPDFQRSSNNSNGPDCNVVVPRRPSPLQAHSQASPLGHASSPAYPLYNSPMNSNSQISSPQTNQATSSPLDVTVPRPGTAQIPSGAYPSVITRALNAERVPERFERPGAPANNQNCWDEQRRKYNYQTGNSIEIPSRQIDVPNRSEPPQRNLIGIPERQQPYFEAGHQVTLQDLSSCRGDPMSIVKNLQQQQQQCQIPQIEVKPESSKKRRKSTEKVQPPPEQLPGRIPPPAHSSAINPQAPQNGAYFDFDRWNLPTPPAKIFTSQGIQQHQPLMVPHIHSAHTQGLPYFPPFHIAPPSEYQSVELTPLTNYNEQNQNHAQAAPPPNAQYQHPPDDQDQVKVVVPNIEEELNFLNDATPPTPRPPQVLQSKAINSPVPGKPDSKMPNKGKEGFINSYLKFLQGERDHSPPPVTKGRKSNWNRSNKHTPDANAAGRQEMNGASASATLPTGPHSHPHAHQHSAITPHAVKLTHEMDIPRRELTKRAAKDRINPNSMKDEDGGLDEQQDFPDSDSDPAWTPAERPVGEEEEPVKRKRGRPPFKNKSPRNLISAAAHDAGISVMDSQGTKVALTMEDNLATAVAKQEYAISNSSIDGAFKPGEFLALKTELNLQWPPALWRIDGKNLLQKYESFDENGIRLYKNISTYSSLMADSKHMYVPVPVKFRMQNQLETVVEFLRNELVIYDQEVLEKSIKSHEVYQDNFEVYIQTLISQALDCNFLKEIFHEKDDYFLTNVKMIDDLTMSKKNKLVYCFRWPMQLLSVIGTWPCFNTYTDCVDAMGKRCAACDAPGASVRLIFFGQPYNDVTLEMCPPDINAPNEKDFMMCRICSKRVELYNKIAHQKYLMYLECARRVQDKRVKEGQKDTTCILNELLADERWLGQLFLYVRKYWGEVDCIEHLFLQRPQLIQ
ncbi:uncharacterized protein [Atheta coriaria]|uniref:uncharacterized protein isoform X2 n=1 Tax=Dalotia coriaria TaxID=877792 RepID=UPI0031F446D1